MKNIPAIIILLLLHLMNTACSEPSAVINPPGYDLTRPVTFKMPSVLEEISGIAFSHGKTDLLYAEQDEEGKLFYFHPGDGDVKHTKFSKRGDYEDVAICNEQVIMLRSDGTMFTFPLSGIANKEMENVQEQAGLLPEGEFESLFADEATNQLYALCKNCDEDKNTQTVSGYVFSVSPDGKLAKKNQFSVDEKAISALAGKDKLKFKPSALARNPLSNQWYILSSVNKLLVVTDAQWKPLGAYSLNPSLFTQPEGIAFDQAGNMFIANEKGNASVGTVLQFNYRKK